MCHGAIIDPALLTRSARWLSLLQLPREQPLPSDFEVWERTIRALTSPRFILSPPLGKFLRRPTDKLVYRSNPTNDIVVCSDEGDNHVLYSMFGWHSDSCILSLCFKQPHYCASSVDTLRLSVFPRLWISLHPLISTHPCSQS